MSPTPDHSVEPESVPDAATDRPSPLAVPPRPVGLGPLGWARWGWRSLTSMRTAIILLALLAVAAVPGSVLPQRGVASDPGAVVNFSRDHPTLAPWLDRLGFFEVFSSPWFAAIYLLLLTSMTGCVLPRCLRLWRATRADPPRAPRDLSRLPDHQHWHTTQPAVKVLAAAAVELRRRRFRVRVDGNTVRAQKGYLREAGNLVFHLSLLVLLFGIAAGALFGFEGRVIVVEGGAFSNTRPQYDEFTPGPLVKNDRLTPFSFTLEKFTAAFEPAGPQRGTPRAFRAEITVTGPDGKTEPRAIEVNHPLQFNGTKVFLTGNGYAPRVTIRDGRGRTVFSGPAVFLPLDGNMTSDGVLKAPDAQPTQLAFEGLFLPTATFDAKAGPRSAFPAPLDPRLVLTAYTGDLGLGNGVPQSVFRLDKTNLTQVNVDGTPFAQALRVGNTMTLPDGKGSVTFDGVSRFANFQVANDPGRQTALLAAILLLIGLTASLTIRQRRVWVRISPDDRGAGCVVQVATYPLTRRGVPEGEMTSLVEVLRAPADKATSPEPVDRIRTEHTPIPATKE